MLPNANRGEAASTSLVSSCELARTFSFSFSHQQYVALRSPWKPKFGWRRQPGAWHRRLDTLIISGALCSEQKDALWSPYTTTTWGGEGLGWGETIKYILGFRCQNKKSRLYICRDMLSNRPTGSKGCTCFFELGGDESRKGPT